MHTDSLPSNNNNNNDNNKKKKKNVIIFFLASIMLLYSNVIKQIKHKVNVNSTKHRKPTYILICAS